jgi:undecaprenyl diphosphate synthase
MANQFTKQKSTYKEFPELLTISKDKFPKHILIIPDGNRRWAKQKNHHSIQGHQKGAEKIIEIVKALQDLKDIRIITLWGFSADNWKRNKDEIIGIFNLINNQILSMLPELKKRNSRFIHLGRIDRIPIFLLKTIQTAEQQTENNSEQTVCLAIDFGGEDQEIRILEKARSINKITKITKEMLWNLRDGHGIVPSADLLIRTSGEQRTSDIGWLNGAPTELYFINKFLPDVTIQDIVQAVITYSKRDRRLGGNKNI